MSIAPDKAFVDLRLSEVALDGLSVELALPDGTLSVSEMMNVPAAPDFTRPAQPGRHRLTYRLIPGLVPDLPDQCEPVEQTLCLHLAPL